MSIPQQLTLNLEGMDCADCAAKLEARVGRLRGVESCAVNFATARMQVAYDAALVDPGTIVSRIRDLGYDIAAHGRSSASAQAGGVSGLLRFMRRRRHDAMTLVAGLLTGLAFALDLLRLPTPLVHASYGAAILASGYYVARKGIRGVWINRALDINFLMSIAAMGAVFIGAWEEGALVMFLFSLGETLESYTMDRARNSIRGFIAVSDQVRPSSVEAIAQLRKIGIERIIMLTGDNESTAAAISARVGVDEARANLLPEDKVRALLAEYRQVAMVGDGVNDAPALAAATVGIAMGGAGTDQALETADIALMADDLRKLPFAIQLSRRTRRIIRQNVTLSLLIKAVFMALALPGLATLWMAVFADMGASLLVILNGMRLLRD